MNDGEAGVRSVLAALRGLVIHSESGTQVEHAGLFHPRFVDFFTHEPPSHPRYALDAPAIH
jgi:hypothetical protein